MFTTAIVDFGLALNESVLRSDSALVLGNRFISTERVARESFHTAFVNLKIAPTISLGLSSSLYRLRTGDHDDYKNGFSFGVLLEPSPKMEVGLAYFHAPKEFSDARLNLEQMDGGTVTGGISYYPKPGTVLSVDVRNLNREEQASSLEIHSGAEYTIGSRLALRAGISVKRIPKTMSFPSARESCRSGARSPNIVIRCGVTFCLTPSYGKKAIPSETGICLHCC